MVPWRGLGDDGELLIARAECSLADVLDERGPLPESEVRAVGATAAEALTRVHDAGLVHGDVKPANLLLSDSGDLWLADFDAASAADGRPLERFSPGRLSPGTSSRPAADVKALALALVELSTGTLIDPDVPWRAGDLRRLGCSPALSAAISFMLGDMDSVPSARATAEMLDGADTDALPAPAVHTRRVDPTPTVEFMPARPESSHRSPPSAPAAADPLRAWWSRLASSWRHR